MKTFLRVSTTIIDAFTLQINWLIYFNYSGESTKKAKDIEREVLGKARVWHMVCRQSGDYRLVCQEWSEGLEFREEWVCNQRIRLQTPRKVYGHVLHQFQGGLPLLAVQVNPFPIHQRLHGQKVHDPSYGLFKEFSSKNDRCGDHF